MRTAIRRGSKTGSGPVRRRSWPAAPFTWGMMLAPLDNATATPLAGFSGPAREAPDAIALNTTGFRFPIRFSLTQYVYTMHRVGKIVPPKRQILKDISLSFLPGAKIGILGLNGAGKSTVLRIMAGIDTEIDGDAIPMPNLTIGYLEQEPKLDPDKTVRETVEESLTEIMEARKRL